MKVFLLTALAVLVFLSGCLVDCSQDLDCFKEKLVSCGQARFERWEDGFKTVYSIDQAEGDYCKVDVVLTEGEEVWLETSCYFVRSIAVEDMEELLQTSFVTDSGLPYFGRCRTTPGPQPQWGETEPFP